jgi:simple sugar transport system ATP-binding protein
VILARELEIQRARVIVAVHPTRGLDIKSVEYVHRLLFARRQAGAAILLISADLDEVLALSDHVGVLAGRAVVATASAEAATLGWLGMHMGGAGQPAVQP